MSIPIGSEVILPSGGRAVLRFVGPVDNKAGVFAGVELLGSSIGKGKNSGDVDGKFYFRTKTTNSGLFLPYSRLVSANPPSGHDTPTRVSRPKVDRSSSLSSRNSPLQLNRASSTGRPSPDNSRLKTLEVELSKSLNENRELSAQVGRFRSEIEEKSFVLSELQTLISETLEPAIAELEIHLASQEEKMERQKGKFKVQREELLLTIASLESQAEESSKIYHEQLSQLRATATESSHSQLEKEYQTLKTSFDEVNETHASEVSCLNKKISHLEAEGQKRQDEILHFKSLHREKEQQALTSERQVDVLKDQVAQLQETITHQNTKSNASEELKSLQDANTSLQQQLDSQKGEKERILIEKDRTIEALEKRIQELSSRESKAAHVVDGELMVYEPDVKVDASAGRKKWCGLCEKQGHDSVECPYETDLMF